MRAENKAMAAWLRAQGIDGILHVKYIWKGSLAGCWRLTRPTDNVTARKTGKLFEDWTEADAAKLNSLGFWDFDNRPLHKHSGNGGMWSVFVRGHKELLEA